MKSGLPVSTLKMQFALHIVYLYPFHTATKNYCNVRATDQIDAIPSTATCRGVASDGGVV